MELSALFNKAIAVFVTLLAPVLGNYVEDPYIKFFFYNDHNEVAYTSTSNTDNLALHSKCSQNGLVTLIVHGWTESCSQLWLQRLVRNLNNKSIVDAVQHNGCIVCMDHSVYSLDQNYKRLYADKFERIVTVLHRKLLQFVAQGFALSNFRVIGYSMGADIVLRAGEQLGPLGLANVDAIDPVNPALVSPHKIVKNPRNAGQHVQCVHCSTNIGTPDHDRCHENWVMGDCGFAQAAEGSFWYGDAHGLCAYFYVFGMTNAFRSRPKPEQCTADNNLARISSVDGQQRMGYKPKSLAGNGTYFADTFRCPPYNEEGDNSCKSSESIFPQ